MENDDDFKNLLLKYGNLKEEEVDISNIASKLAFEYADINPLHFLSLAFRVNSEDEIEAKEAIQDVMRISLIAMETFPFKVSMKKIEEEVERQGLEYMGQYVFEKYAVDKFIEFGKKIEKAKFN